MLKHFITSIAFSLPLAAIGQTKNFLDMPYLEVAGSADSMVVPNQILIKILISEKSTKDKVPLQKTEADMYNSLASIGINTDKDLVVHDMASTFRTYLLKANSVIKSREYILTVKDANTAAKVFIELEKLDIGNSRIFAVNHTDMEQIKNELRSKAVVNAKTRATALTKPINQSVGNAIHLEDNEEYHFVGTDALRRKSERLAYASNVADGFRVDDPIDIEFTKISVKANVKAKFALK